MHGGIRSLGLDPDTIDFSVNINPLGMHPVVAQRVIETVHESAEYPDTAAAMLEEALSVYAGVEPDMVVAGNGATEIIYNICRIMQGGTILVVDPAFGEYAAAARLSGANVRSIQDGEITGDRNRYADAARSCRCAFVCNPTNPTGRLTDRDVILEMASSAPDTIMVVDECFMELAVRDESVLPSVPDNVVVLRSLTKSFGLAGLRVGYCIAPPDLARRLRLYRIPWSINVIAQTAGIEAIRHTSHLVAGRKLIRKEVAYITDAMLSTDGIEPYPTDANYILARTVQTGRTVQERFLQLGMLVRDCSDFEGLDSHHIRIGVRQRWENRLLVMMLEHACQP